MSEEKIVEVVNEALAAAGSEDTVTAAGEFSPRGHSGMRLPITHSKDVIRSS